MEFYKETKVAGGDCETPPSPTRPPGLGDPDHPAQGSGAAAPSGLGVRKEGGPWQGDDGRTLAPLLGDRGPALEKPYAGSPSSHGLQAPPSPRQTHLDSPEDELRLPRAPYTGATQGPIHWGRGPHTVGPKSGSQRHRNAGTILLRERNLHSADDCPSLALQHTPGRGPQSSREDSRLCPTSRREQPGTEGMGTRREGSIPAPVHEPRPPGGFRRGPLSPWAQLQLSVRCWLRFGEGRDRPGG